MIRRAMRLTIAIPAYDEAGNLERVVGEALGALASGGSAGEILIVDDGSTDGTASIADSLSATHANVRVIRHPVNRGFSGAMTTCFRGSLGEWVFLAAGDGQTDMSDISRAIAMVDTTDVVVGVRDARAEGFSRKLLSRAFHLFARALFALPEREFSSVFLFRRSILSGMRFRSSARSAALLPEVLYRARRRGARIVTLAVHPRPRLSGRAKGGQLSVALRTSLELVRVALLARWDERNAQVASPLEEAAVDPVS